MPVYFDTAKKRWRFTFNRLVGEGAARRRHRATKLLPAGWSQRRAEAYDRQEGGRLYAQASGIEDRGLTLSGAVKLYVDNHLPDLKDRVNIGRELAHLFPSIEGRALADAAEVAHAYADEQRDLLAAATIRNRLAYLKAAIRYAYRRHRYGDRNFAERIILPKVSNERHRYEKVDTVRALLAKIGHEEDRAVFTLAFWCGLRWRASVLPRQPGDVEKKGRDVWLSVGLTKNGTPRMKFVPTEARWALKLLPFATIRHWRTRYASYEAAVAAMGIVDLVAHDLRHALASDIVSRGGSLPDVGAALDHDSPISSNRYAHLYPERLKSIMQGVGGRKNAHRPQKKKAA